MESSDNFWALIFIALLACHEYVQTHENQRIDHIHEEKPMNIMYASFTSSVVSGSMVTFSDFDQLD